MVDTLTKEQRSYCMSKIRSKNTKPELLLRRRLFKKGYRYRINYKNLPGTPDIVFIKQKVAIFIDGDFWHGRDFKKRKHTYNRYWLNKINGNMERDKRVDKELVRKGWKVLRIWGKDLAKDPDRSVIEIERVLK